MNVKEFLKDISSPLLMVSGSGLVCKTIFEASCGYTKVLNCLSSKQLNNEIIQQFVGWGLLLLGIIVAIDNLNLNNQK